MKAQLEGDYLRAATASCTIFAIVLSVGLPFLEKANDTVERGKAAF